MSFKQQFDLHMTSCAQVRQLAQAAAMRIFEHRCRGISPSARSLAGPRGLRQTQKCFSIASLDAMSKVFRGRVQAGKGDASRWLTLFNEAYSRKLGHAVYPGSLNLALEQDFNWFDPAYEESIVWFGRAEYGGERDILFLPCELRVPDGRRAWLWTPTNSARDRPDPWVIELVAEVGLRDNYALEDGSTLELTLQLSPERGIRAPRDD